MPPRKKQARPAPPSSRMRTRTMGYSPGGPKSLETEVPVPKPAPSARFHQKETRRSRKDPGLMPKVNKSAATGDDADVTTSSTIATEATSSENVVASTLETSPHLTTPSRSQSPHLETESDSLQVLESPSTTPPPRQTRSMTRSVSPSAAEQQYIQQEPKPKQAAAKSSPRLFNNKRKATEVDEELENIEGKDKDTSAIEERAAKRSRRDEPRYVFGEPAQNFNNSNKRKATTEFDEGLENYEGKDSNNFEEPSAKRSRRDEQRPIHNESTPTFADSAPAVAEDSSADDVTAEPERPPRPSRNRSRSVSRQPVPTTTVNPEDASAEESSSDNQQPEASRQLSLTLFQPSGKPLTPKPVPSTSPSRKLITDDIAERNQMYKEITGRDMPVPRNQIGLQKYGRTSYREEDDEEIDMDAVAERMTPNRPRDNMLLNRVVLLQEKLRKERAQAEKAQKKRGANATSSGPSEKHFRYHKIVVPADATSGEYVLTGSRVIGPIRAFCRYAEHNPSHHLPNDAQMEQILIEFNARESVQPVSPAESSRSIDHSTRTPTEASTSQPELHRLVGSQQPLSLEAGAQVGTMVTVQVAEEAATQDQASEVQSEVEEAATHHQASEVQTEVEEPQAPTTPTHGWLSSVSSFLTTPIKYFGRGSQSTEAVNTNDDAVVGGSPDGLLIPQTSDFAIPQNNPLYRPNSRVLITKSNRGPVMQTSGFANPPVTPTNRRDGRKLMAQSERRPVMQISSFANPPVTPTNRSDVRKLMAQTERRPGILVQGPKTGPKTDRHVRFQSPAEERTPIHMRGMLSEERKQEIWRKQDEDLHLKERQDLRAEKQARVEDEDEHDTNLDVEPARAGQKRKQPNNAERQARVEDEHEHDANLYVEPACAEEKRKHSNPIIRPADWNHEGTFSVPDSPTSSEEGEEGGSQDAVEQPVNQPVERPIDPRFPGTSIRKNRYDGTLFAQPPDVQANIDEGKHPLAKRNGDPKELSLGDNLFATPSQRQSTAEEQARWDKIFCSRNPTTTTNMDVNPSKQTAEVTTTPATKPFKHQTTAQELAYFDKIFGPPKDTTTTDMDVNPSKQTAEVTTTPATPAGSANGSGTFSAPDYDVDEEEETTVEMERGTEEDAAGDESVLQQKPWSQTPPPKPKPSNAQLPQGPAPATPSELAKARYEKFKPTRPSGLRNMSVMSPLAQPEATTDAPAQPEATTVAPTQNQYPHPLWKFIGSKQMQNPHRLWESDLSEHGFDPVVLKALWEIPDKDLIETKLPAYLYKERSTFSPEVEAAVRAEFGDKRAEMA